MENSDFLLESQKTALEILDDLKEKVLSGEVTEIAVAFHKETTGEMGFYITETQNIFMFLGYFQYSLISHRMRSETR